MALKKHKGKQEIVSDFEPGDILEVELGGGWMKFRLSFFARNERTSPMARPILANGKEGPIEMLAYGFMARKV